MLVISRLPHGSNSTRLGWPRCGKLSTQGWSKHIKNCTSLRANFPLGRIRVDRQRMNSVARNSTKHLPHAGSSFDQQGLTVPFDIANKSKSRNDLSIYSARNGV